MVVLKIVPPVAEEVRVVEPVPDFKFKAEDELVAPILTVSIPEVVAPVPILMVLVPVVITPAPKLMAVYAVVPLPIFKAVVVAPKALTVVAVVFNRSNEAEPATSEVVMVGDVPKTATPEPVSSVNEVAKTEEAKDETKFLDPSVATTDEAVSPEKVMVPDDVIPVAPVMAPRVEIFKVLEARLKVPVELPIEVVEVPVVFIEVVPVSVNPPVPWSSPEPELTPTKTPAPEWAMLKLAPEISLPVPELVMLKTSPVALA